MASPLSEARKAQKRSKSIVPLPAVASGAALRKRATIAASSVAAWRVGAGRHGAWRVVGEEGTVLMVVMPQAKAAAAAAAAVVAAGGRGSRLLGSERELQLLGTAEELVLADGAVAVEVHQLEDLLRPLDRAALLLLEQQQHLPTGVFGGRRSSALG